MKCPDKDLTDGLHDMWEDLDKKERNSTKTICPKCGSEMNPEDTCVGCRSRYRQSDLKCWNCTRTITPDGEHPSTDKDNYEHECGHEEKVTT